VRYLTTSSRSAAAVALALWTLALPPHSHAAESQAPPQDLKSLSIEQLMEIDVTLATREAEPVRRTAAAIAVVTGDDIRRSGVTTIADALALADGVHVARFNNGTWAVSARGFNATSANKMLVMVDGRIEYSPLFSGAFWNTLDYTLEDIDRIEVIRGPGATLWGANAVNGVVNIVTRHSRDTQGTLLAFGTGNEDPALADFRYGSAAAGMTYRVYGKFVNRSAQKFDDGTSAEDERRRGQVGFRMDRPGAGGEWMVKGDVFRSGDELPDRPSGNFGEIALQGGWSRSFGAGSEVAVNSYYRRESRDVPLQLTHHIDTFDAEMQHGFAWGELHRVIWGAGWRRNSDETNGGSVAFVPADRAYSVFSVFGQDEITILPDRFNLTLGIKADRNAFSGLEWQPNVRARLDVAPRQVLWGAVSRATRRPTRLDVDVRAFAPTGALVAVGGGEAYESEHLVAAELGYRSQPLPFVAMDATVFTHSYDDLRSQELPITGPPIVVGNTLNGRSQGVELGASLQPLSALQVRAGYTFLDVSITKDLNSRDVAGGTTEANDPSHTFLLRTDVDLPRRVELTFFLRSIGELPDPNVPQYTELSGRVGWRATDHLELSISGQDLLHDRHPEFGGLTPRRVEFERSIRVHAAFRY
jgi:iron complex outermembrane receptor protein